MIDNNTVKKIVHIEQPQTVHIKDKMSVVQRFIFDKTKEEITIEEPWGNTVFKASIQAQRLITDIQMMDYFFHCAVLYYKRILN